jgi:hypothetical protein
MRAPLGRKRASRTRQAFVLDSQAVPAVGLEVRMTDALTPVLITTEDDVLAASKVVRSGRYPPPPKSPRSLKKQKEVNHDSIVGD